MKQKTEILLCKAFMDLMKKYPFPKITIQKIASKCGVNRQTFYYHYDNIYDLMASAFEYEVVNEGRMFEADSWDEVVKCFLKWMKKNRIVMKNILTNIESRYLRQAMYPLMERSLKNHFRPDIDSGRETEMDEEFLHRFLVFGITQYIIEWAEADFKENIDVMTHEMLMLLNKLYS